jgi:hypothetical protein
VVFLIVAPCKGCALRTVGCHSLCLNYVEYKKQVEFEKNHANIGVLSEIDYQSYKNEKIWKMKRESFRNSKRRRKRW